MQLTEAIAGDVFQRADRAHEVVTMAMIQVHLKELAAHPPDCRCRNYCRAASVVSPEAVWRVATTWQRQCERR